MNRTVRFFVQPAIFLLAVMAWAQARPASSMGQDVFVEDESLSGILTKFGAGGSAWGRIDDDDHVDLVIGGFSHNLGSGFVGVFLNDDLGGGNLTVSQLFTFQSPYDTLSAYGGISLGDFENEGDLDILFTGGGGNADSVLFLNDSRGVFLPRSGPGLPSSLFGKPGWADFDNDGDLDLFLMGLVVPDLRIITAVYLNDPLGSLSFDLSQPLANIANGDGIWGDYDNDGDLDLVVAGQSAQAQSNVIKVYKNEPTGRLIEDTSQRLTGLKAAVLSWIDFDSDGDLDLVATGWQGTRTATYLYKNEPVGSLSLSDSIPFGVAYGSMDVGDFDNDGDLDLVMAGADSVSEDAEGIQVSTAMVFANDGEGHFDELQKIQGGMNASWADYDGDDDLDLFVNGFGDARDFATAYSRVYRNTGDSKNSPPEPPASLSSFAVGNRVVLTWTDGSDDLTPNSALTYNVRFGTRTNADTVLSGHVPVGGGNVGQRLMKLFHDIAPDTYTWSVQAVDQGLRRSDWAREDTLFIPRLVESLQSLSGMWYNAAAWNDYNGDGKLDLALTGSSFSLGDRVTRLFKNDPLGVLTQDTRQDLESVVGGCMAWGDYDNDGYLDILLAGFTADFIPVTYLYRWNPAAGRFDLEQDQDLSQVWGGSQAADWADFDSDGDLDLVLGGTDDTGALVLRIYENSDTDSLVERPGQDVVPVGPGVIAWVDFNNDGFPDLFTSGLESGGNSRLTIYMNDSSGMFTKSNAYTLPGEGVQAGSAAWGDYDGDGFMDLAITGLYETGELTLKIFHNDDSISLRETFSVAGVHFGGIDWGDYDNDGDLDFAVSGNSTFIPNTVGADPVTKVYVNTGDEDNLFVEDSSLSLDGAGASSVAWGDYDHDGDLDLLVAGISSSGDEFTRVYDNLEATRNRNLPPASPTGLTEEIDTSKVLLTWDHPEDDSTPVTALTYDIQVDSIERGDGIISGNTSYGFGDRWRPDAVVLRHLADGRYYWRVRAVDNGLSRSEWSAARSFYFDIAPPELDSVEARFGTGKQVILIVTFKEANGMDNTVSPAVAVSHPEGAISDRLLAEQQSYSGNVWTGSVDLPQDFPGTVIKVSLAGARDLWGYEMDPETVYRSPSKVVSRVGGTVVSCDGIVTLTLSPNAVGEDVEMSIHPVEPISSELVPQGAHLIGNVYRISPQTAELRKPSILAFTYDTAIPPVDTLEFDLDSLFIGQITSADSSLKRVGGRVRDWDGTLRITTYIDSLGVFGVFKDLGFSVGEFRKLAGLSCKPRIFSPRGGTFDNRTNIIFDLDQGEAVTVRVFSLNGRLVRTVVSEELLSPGANAVAWDGRDENGTVIVSGLYIVTVETSREKAATTVGVLNK